MSNAASHENKKGRSSIPVREGSGNVFEDLGVPESAEALAKSEIAARIAGVIERRGLTQSKAASLLEVSQADVSDLVSTRGLAALVAELLVFSPLLVYAAWPIDRTAESVAGPDRHAG